MITRPNQFCGRCGNPLFPGDRSCALCGLPLGSSGTDFYDDAPVTIANLKPLARPLPLGKIILVQSIAIILLFMLVLVLLVHTFVGSNPTSQRNPSNPGGVVPTPTPSGPHILYQADWSNDLAGWTGTADWQTRDGQLVNDGANAIHNLASPTIMVPFDLSGIADYAVEAQIQLAKTVASPGFGFFVRYDNNGHGYIAGAGSPQGGPPSVFEVTTADGWHAPLQKVNFTPGKNWHTYRIEVKQARIKVFIDGGLALNVEDASYPSGEFVGLWDSNAQLAISNFVIESL